MDGQKKQLLTTVFLTAALQQAKKGDENILAQTALILRSLTKEELLELQHNQKGFNTIIETASAHPELFNAIRRQLIEMDTKELRTLIGKPERSNFQSKLNNVLFEKDLSQVLAMYFADENRAKPLQITSEQSTELEETEETPICLITFNVPSDPVTMKPRENQEGEVYERHAAFTCLLNSGRHPLTNDQIVTGVGDIYEEINSLLVPADKLRQSLEEYLAEMTTEEDSVAEIESEEAIKQVEMISAEQMQEVVSEYASTMQPKVRKRRMAMKPEEAREILAEYEAAANIRVGGHSIFSGAENRPAAVDNNENEDTGSSRRSQ